MLANSIQVLPKLLHYCTTPSNFEKNYIIFNLQKPQLDAMEKLKTLIMSALILKLFDPNFPTRLRIDARKD